MSVHIGQWVRRERRGVPHLVESVIAGDAITRCGRRMTDEPNSNGLLMLADFGVRKCRQCVSEREIGGN
jgi:hypothetical protein